MTNNEELRKSEYPEDILQVLKSLKIEVGHRVRLYDGESATEGILLPRPDRGNDRALVIKRDDGYNVGVVFSNDLKLEKIGDGEKLESFPLIAHKSRKDLLAMSIIATGGTISSRLDYTTGAVHPLFEPSEFLFTMPEIAQIVNIRDFLTPFRLASEDMSIPDIQEIARLVAQELITGAEGVCVTHGTDTLHFTAAALSFMLDNLTAPVALVGAQRSPDRGSNDGVLNMICAAHYCSSDIAEVAVVMHGTSEDTYAFAIRGTKVRKMHTSRRDTFRPINIRPLAKIWADGRIEEEKGQIRRRNDGEVLLRDAFEAKVTLLKAFPGSNPEILEFCIDRGYRGVVIEATGLGHVPTQTRAASDSWLPTIQRAIEEEILVAFAPQCLYGRLQPYVYSNARIMNDLGVIYLEDMLPETAYIKIGWVLGQSEDLNEAKKLLLTNIAGEFGTPGVWETFLY
ncbi:MAG: Glu-tRNA(Gln) amidotransferase subunit GatD [Candidatus Thorarchaeota archaeon]